MIKDKIIKDLKERNEKLSNQYRLRDIRCVHLEMENADLQQRIDKSNEFIEYLENEINKWHYNYDNYTYEYELEEPTAEELLQTVLSKYKEIIGGKKW